MFLKMKELQLNRGRGGRNRGANKGASVRQPARQLSTASFRHESPEARVGMNQFNYAELFYPKKEKVCHWQTLLVSARPRSHPQVVVVELV